MNERKVRICNVDQQQSSNAGELLPVWNSRPPVAWFVDLSVDSFHRGTAVWRTQGETGALRTLREMVRVAVRINAAAVH